jgi:hypothetical protein
MNFTNCVEDGTQLFKYSREICYYHVSTIIFSMGNVTAMSEHQKGSYNLLRFRGN